MTRVPVLKQAASKQASLALFAKDVLAGLSGTPKQLSSQYLYDAVGSALFEAITQLPEYGLTRADMRVLRRAAPQLAAQLPGEVAIAELGSGSGNKTRHVLTAFSGRRGLRYFPIDVSSAALERCATDLSMTCEVDPICATYLDGIGEVASRRKTGQRLLTLFVGSTIGNFHPAEAGAFFASLRELLEPGDALLVGADLVKPSPVLLAAYDDPAGVTAAFNRNLLCRINRDLGGTFDVAAFRHEARYNSSEQRIEMHLRSTIHQTVEVGALGLEFEFRKNETIWTESSYKFELPQLDALAASSGFTVEQVWVDSQWPFAECLWMREGGDPPR